MAGHHATNTGSKLPWRHWATALFAALTLGWTAIAVAQSPVATMTEPRRGPLPVTSPPPLVPMVPEVYPPPTVPFSPDWERGNELYAQAHDALAAGQADLSNRLFAEACQLFERRSCFNTGLDLEARAERPGAPAELRSQTLTAYRSSCTHDFQRGCIALARLQLDAAWGVPTPLPALALLEQACRRGEAEGCEILADQYYRGTFVTIDYARAARLYRQACDRANRLNSCFNFGLMAERGRGMPRSDEYALRYYRLACRAGSFAGCHNLATNYAYADKNKVPDRMVIARSLLKRNCERNYLASCTTFGQFIREFEKPTDNFAEAVTALTKACDGKDGLACRILGNMAHDKTGVPGSNRAANKFYERSCNLSYGDGCYNLGLVYWSGYRVKANAETAIAWFGRGCELNSASSCAGAYLATLNLPKGHALAGEEMARRWLALGEAIEPGNNLVQTIKEAYENRKAVPAK